MPAAVSTAVIRARALQVSGLPLANFGDTNAINLEIVADAKNLHDEMILSGGHYQRGVTSVPVSAGLQTDTLDPTIYLVETAHFIETGSQPMPVELEQWSPPYLGEVLAITSQQGRPRWFEVTAGLNGLQPVDMWRIWPTPDRAGTLYLTYVQSVVFPTTGGEQLIYAGNGWEDYLVHALAAKLLAAEETDNSQHLAERERHRARIMAMSARRHSGPPARTPIRAPVAGSRSRYAWGWPGYRSV